MQRREILTILALLFSFLSVACDNVCKKTVEDLAVVQNMTNRSLSLEVCKNPNSLYREKQILTVPQDSNLNQVSLGARAASEIRGGPQSMSCSGVDDTTEIAPFSLTASSFGSVKNCLDQASNKYVLVETFQSCPSGFLEQTAAADCTQPE